MADGDSEVVVHPGDLSPAVDLLRRYAVPPDDIVAWVEVAPVDPPAELLPEQKGLFGRRKRAEAPSFQVIYPDPGQGGGPATLSISAAGSQVDQVLAAAGTLVPVGWTADGGKGTLLVETPAGADPEHLIRFGVEALRALLGGWDGWFRAVGFGVEDFRHPDSL